MKAKEGMMPNGEWWNEPVTTTAPRYARMLTNGFALVGLLYMVLTALQTII